VTAPELDVLANAAYDACPTPKQTWAQIGDVTKGVWRERAALQRITDLEHELMELEGLA